MFIHMMKKYGISLYVIGVALVLYGCAYPMAPRDDFSMLPDNAFSDAVKKYIPLDGRIDVDGVAHDFLERFRGQEMEKMRWYFAGNGGRCGNKQPGSTVRCWVRIKWLTVGGRGFRCKSKDGKSYYPPPCKPSVGFLYKLGFGEGRLNSVAVWVKNVEPTNL